jgi:DNA mismatch repair ATPase MutS
MCLRCGLRYLALASVAVTHGYVRPHLVSENVIELDDGRHPLKELVVDAFVPNSTSMRVDHGGPDHEPVLLVTGPNNSGKSVFMRQVALITIMAHVGSFVPCASARIGPVDAIFSRLDVFDANTSSLSTFQSDACAGTYE